MNRKECDYCIKNKTMYCPNSSECYSLDDLPNFRTNFDVLKENHTLNKGIDELLKKYEDKIEDRIKTIEHFKTKNEKEMVIMNRQAKFDYEQFIQDLKKLKGE